MTYKISQIASILGVGTPRRPELTVSTLLTDSRSLLTPDETIFFALRTASADGHRYIGELYRKGVRNFVVDVLPEDSESMADANFLVVDSTLGALQKIASAHRDRFDIPVVGITGSRGKTTVKEWMYHLLEPSMHTVRSPRSFNSQIGVPLSLWEIDDDTRLAVIEAGISEKGEMERLQSMIRPTIAVFTNIGGAHREGFAGIEEKCAEKTRLFKDVETAIFCGDNELIAASIPECANRLGWSLKNPDAPLYGKVATDGKSSEIRYDYKPGNLHGSFTIPFSSQADIENAMNSLALMLALGVCPDDIASRMATLTPVNTRLEVIEAVNGSQIIHDTYTADLVSLAQALDFMDRRIIPGQTKTLVLGTLDDDSYPRVATLCRERGVGKVILVGRKGIEAKGLFGPDAMAFETVDALTSALKPSDFVNELILLKGQPGEHLEKITEALEARRHETVLEINLDAVVHNFNFFRSVLRPTTGMVCMIKASGYGAGSYELAKTLQSQGAAYFAVAVHDEGASLRKQGITLPIIVLNPTVDNFRSLFDNRLEPEIYSIDFLRTLIAEADRLGIKGYPVHIKIDSGMHRLGFRTETLPEVIEVLKSTDAVVPASIFSHLCCADDPQEDDYTRSQFEYFDRCCRMIDEAFPGRKILHHILNSTGILRFPEHQMDLVRLGIGLYGVRTMHDGSQDALRPVSTLRSLIISLKSWPAGTTVGYNRRGRLTRPSVIATVPIGYADGINRHLGYGNAKFEVNGVLCPTVGSICMDACMIDVTDVPDVRVGMGVEIFGEKVSVDTLAETLQTISYEVLTSVSERVKRVYYRE